VLSGWLPCRMSNDGIVATIEVTTAAILNKLEKIMAALDDLKAADAAEAAANTHILAVLTDLSAKLTAALAAGDQTAVEAVAADMNARVAALNAAATTADPGV